MNDTTTVLSLDRYFGSKYLRERIELLTGREYLGEYYDYYVDLFRFYNRFGIWLVLNEGELSHRSKRLDDSIKELIKTVQRLDE